jgi:hypothetical protein
MSKTNQADSYGCFVFVVSNRVRFPLPQSGLAVILVLRVALTSSLSTGKCF